MVFEDLTDFDLNLIKSLAVGLLVDTKLTNRFEALTEIVFSCIHAKGYRVDSYSNQLVSIISKHLTPIEFRGSISKEYLAVDVIRDIFKYLKDNNIEISKDNREPTWSSPRSAWYTPYVSPKKPWMF